MAFYKDAAGTRIRVGDVVATAVTMNHARFPEGFVTKVCRKHKDGRLILDGSIGWTYLADTKQSERTVIRPDTDLRRVATAFIRANYPPTWRRARS